MTVVAVSEGWILVAVLLVVLGGVVYGFFTRSGSGISEHPLDSREAAPGAEGRSEISGKDQGEGSSLDTHGTR